MKVFYIRKEGLDENGRTPDIVSAYSLEGGFTLATDMCEEKSNEITSVPKLLDIFLHQVL